MTDYDKATGSAGTLRIRDTGSTIELWVLCSDGATWAGNVTFDTVINGSRQANAVSLPAGFGSKLIRSASQAAGSQTVELNMPYTGTSGLGGPTSHSQALTQGSAPGKPGPVVASDITLTSALLSWTAAANSPTTYGLYVSEKSDFSTYFFQAWVGNVLSRPMPGLNPGTKYYARTRGSNAIGAGPYSDTTSFQTLSGVRVGDDATTNFDLCEVFVDVGAAAVADWRHAEVLRSDGTTWKAAV